MMGVGGPFITIGVRFLFEWSPEETSWEAYHTMKLQRGVDVTDATRPGTLSPLKLTAAGITPLSRGAVAFVAIAF
jgi:hypothetical protein